MIPSVTMDVSTSDSVGGPDPSKHSTVMFKLDLPSTTNRPIMTDEVDEANRGGSILNNEKGKKTKLHKYGSFAGGAKIPKTIKIS